MMKRGAALLLALLALALGTAVHAADPWKSWKAKENRRHALVGKIWSAEKKDFVTREDYKAALGQADAVLLGENHDNPDHHRLQAWAIEQIAAAKRPAAVIFEMIGPDEAGAIPRDVPAKKAAEAARKLGPAVKWQERGWPSWSIYEPVARAAFKAGFSIHGGDASQAALRDVAKGGLPAIGPSEQERLGLGTDLEPELNEALLQELFDGHCQLLEKTKLGPMATVQRLRDATLAASMVKARPKDGVAILIAGNGHVRRDRGVPLYLARSIPPERILVVLHVEVQAETDDPLAHIPKAPDGSPAADLVVFTPGADRGDPCQSLRDMKKQG